MAFHHTARTTHHPRGWTFLLTAFVLSALVLAVLLHTRTSPDGTVGPAVGASFRPEADGGADARVPETDGGADAGLPLSPADGVVPEGTVHFGDGIPAVGNLAPDLHNALRMAVSDAADSGIGISITSGWRSRQYQEQLLQEAVAQYGSASEAARWVATPDTSPHVTGDAVDVGPLDATEWLSVNGARYGLCQIYANEPWHYELRPDASRYGCPVLYADPTWDPRMQ